MKKAWRVCSTNPEFGAKLGETCSNRPGRGDVRVRVSGHRGRIGGGADGVLSPGLVQGLDTAHPAGERECPVRHGDLRRSGTDA
eukprot:2531656-Pyramimonas_sp.AAC.1